MMLVVVLMITLENLGTTLMPNIDDWLKQPMRGSECKSMQ